jgi:hypothetical protein
MPGKGDVHDMSSRHTHTTENGGGNIREMINNLFHLISTDQVQHGFEPESELKRASSLDSEVVCAKYLVDESNTEKKIDMTEYNLENLSCLSFEEAPKFNEKPCEIPPCLNKTIEDEIGNRSMTWILDWIYDLKDSQDADRSKKYLKLSSISIVKQIREELHHLHSKMVRSHCLQERVKSDPCFFSLHGCCLI